jgi:hypothetical protein
MFKAPATSGGIGGFQDGEFSKAYLCPSADKNAIYTGNNKTNGFMYHASYWTNPALRVNLGWQNKNSPNLGGSHSYIGKDELLGMTTSDLFPGTIEDHNASKLSARIVTVCPQATIGAHFRSVYHPSPDSVRNPNAMVFIGDTNNVAHTKGNNTSPAGDWGIALGYGKLQTCLGFERHGDKILIGYADGHSRSLPQAEAVHTGVARFGDGEIAGDPWFVKYIGEDGCKQSSLYMHTLANPVTD